MGLLDILGGPVTGIIGSVNDIIGKFVTSPEDKLKAQLEISKLQTDFTIKMAELDGEWAKTQAGVITAETQSHSWMARNWRPILMLSFTYIIVHTYVIVPVFHIPAVDIPPDMWDLLRLGMGGYVIGRSAEKIVPQVTSAIVQAKQSK